MPESTLTILGLVAVVILVAANGLFVATEFAYVAVRRSRVEQLAAGGQSRAKLLLASLHDLDNYIAATQLGITMSSLALGWVGVFMIGPLTASLSTLALVLLIAGGVLYSVGVLFHVWRSLPYQNAIWHAFVLIATGCHFAAVSTAVFG